MLTAERDEGEARPSCSRSASRSRSQSAARRSPNPDGTARRAILRETLREGATRITDASCARAELLLDQPGFGVFAWRLTRPRAMGASNSLEKMLAHQMAVAHDAALRLMSQSMQRAERDSKTSRLLAANTAARACCQSFRMGC